MRNLNLATAMAEKCAEVIRDFPDDKNELPKPLRPSHLLWMCDQIVAHAGNWSAAHIHRWIGFIQSAMLTNGMLDLAGLKSMFDEAKTSYGVPDDDQDLVDHLDPDNSFKLDIGGQG